MLDGLVNICDCGEDGEEERNKVLVVLAHILHEASGNRVHWSRRVLALVGGHVLWLCEGGRCFVCTRDEVRVSRTMQEDRSRDRGR